MENNDNNANYYKIGLEFSRFKIFICHIHDYIENITSSETPAICFTLQDIKKNMSTNVRFSDTALVA